MSPRQDPGSVRTSQTPRREESPPNEGGRVLVQVPRPGRRGTWRSVQLVDNRFRLHPRLRTPGLVLVLPVEARFRRVSGPPPLIPLQFVVSFPDRPHWSFSSSSLHLSVAYPRVSGRVDELSKVDPSRLRVPGDETPSGWAGRQLGYPVPFRRGVFVLDRGRLDERDGVSGSSTVPRPGRGTGSTGVGGTGSRALGWDDPRRTDPVGIVRSGPVTRKDIRVGCVVLGVGPSPYFTRRIGAHRIGWCE